MPTIIMTKKEASTWPFIALVTFSTLFAVVCVPALIIGALDKENFGLFVITAILVVPQMVGVWVATWCAWKEKSNV